MERASVLDYLHRNPSVKLKMDDGTLYTVIRILAEGQEKLEFTDLKGGIASLKYGEIKEVWAIR